jgi:formate dehydrogenase assembly factor FdhD
MTRVVLLSKEIIERIAGDARFARFGFVKRFSGRAAKQTTTTRTRRSGCGGCGRRRTKMRNKPNYLAFKRKVLRLDQEQLAVFKELLECDSIKVRLQLKGKAVATTKII